MLKRDVIRKKCFLITIKRVAELTNLPLFELNKNVLTANSLSFENMKNIYC